MNAFRRKGRRTRQLGSLISSLVAKIFQKFIRKFGYRVSCQATGNLTHSFYKYVQWLGKIFELLTYVLYEYKTF